MTVETYANLYTTSLSGNGGSITNVQTTINLASGTGAPSGQARFIVDNELIVGSISGTVLTATIRGAEGTTAASHTDGTTIKCVLTAAGLLASPGVMTTKGDIVAGAASGQPTRLPVGSNGQALVADSAQTTGVKWAAAGASLAAPALTLSTSNATGAASTAIGTDATIAAFDATVPVTQASADAAATGSAGVAARRDHKHGMPTLYSDPLTTKGDILAHGSVTARLPVGSDTQVLTADSTQTLGVKWAAASGGGGGGINGAGLLASLKYAPGSLQTKTTTSSTFSTVDSTNLSITFIAPSSGKVIFRLSGTCRSGNAGMDVAWGVGPHGGSVDATTKQCITNTNTDNIQMIDMIVTGLTGGTSYTYDWFWCSGDNSSTATFYIYDGRANQNAPACMYVYDASIQGAGGGGQPVFATTQAIVATSESTATSTYTDLATVGPSVTVVVPNSGQVWVDISASVTAGTGGAMSVDVSGANTIAASDAHCLFLNSIARSTYKRLYTGLTPGSTTFKAKYAAELTTCTWSNREIAVSPVDGDTSGVANPMTTAGDIIVGGVSGAAGRLAVGGAGTLLASVSSTPAWTSTITFGSGAPSGGADGQFYFRTDTPGTSNQRLYVHTGGVWVGIL